MKSQADKNPATNIGNAVANRPAIPQTNDTETSQTESISQESIAQRQLQEAANNSAQVKQLKVLQAMANRRLFNTAQLKATNPTRENWHVAQRAKATANEAADAVVQKISGALAQHDFFRPAAHTNNLPHLHPGAGTVQRATLQVTTVDYDPTTNTKHDFDVNQAKTTGILTAANKAAKANLQKVYKQPVTNTFNNLSADAGKQVTAADVPTLATDLSNEVLGRYGAANPGLGALPQGQKDIVTNAVTTALHDFMKDRIFGHGLQTKAAKADFTNLITVSTTKSRDKGTANTISQAALNGVDANANNAATAVDAAFTVLHAVNPPGITPKARKAQYETDLGGLPAAGRDIHHNVAGWLPALARPAVAPWAAAAPDHKRSSALAWVLSHGAPSLYIEFNGGPTVSRIVYDPMSGTSYATMHYTSIGGYNPFFKII